MASPRSTRDFEADKDGVENGVWATLSSPGGSMVRQAIFERHVAWAKRIARRHFLDRSRGDIEYADLCQLAYAGLLEAIDHYDPSRGAPFKSFASRRIGGSILDGLSKTSEVRQQISARNRMRQERLRSLAAGEENGLSPAEALRALSELAGGLALGFMLEDANLLAEKEGVDPTANAYESLAWKEVLSKLAAEINQLGSRDRDIIRHHYRDGLTFDQIAGVLGLSKGRVSQLHKAAIALLRRRLTNKGVASSAP